MNFSKLTSIVFKLKSSGKAKQLINTVRNILSEGDHRSEWCSVRDERGQMSQEN